jgi:MFS family permease
MKGNILRTLSEKSFLYLWIGEIFTQISINFFNFFAILITFKETHSNTAVAGIVLSFTIPALIFGSIAGAYVDRWDKKKVLIFTNIFRALLFLVLIFYINNLWMLYLLGFMVAVFTQFFIPAETPMIPLVVKSKNLLSANALFGIALYGSILIAYVLSGPMIVFLKPVSTLIFLAIMLLIGAAIIALVKPNYAKPEKVKKQTPNLLKELKHAITFMSQTKEISGALFLLALSQILILVIATIAPGYANQVLGINVEDFSLVFVAPAAFGVLVGAVILVNVFHSHPKQKIINTGIFLSGLAMLFLPYGSKVASRDFVHTINMYIPHFLEISIIHIMVVIAFILGFANSFIFVPANTILQEKTSEELRGKIYGFLNTAVGILALLPIIIVGGLSDLIGVGFVITGIGAILLFLGIARLFIK